MPLLGLIKGWLICQNRYKVGSLFEEGSLFEGGGLIKDLRYCVL